MKYYNKIIKYLKKNIILLMILLFVLFLIGSMINIKEGFALNNADCDEYYNVLKRLNEISLDPNSSYYSSTLDEKRLLYNRFQKVTGRGFDEGQDLKNIDPSRKAGCERGTETVLNMTNVYIVIGIIVAIII